MIKKLVLTAAFLFVPAAAMAQHHTGHHAPAHSGAAGVSEHKDFAVQLIEMRAELKLTDVQVAKLRDLSAKMAEHHKSMGKDAERDAAAEELMHSKLRAVFNAEQLKKVNVLMAKHVAEVCGGNGTDGACKLPSKE